MFRFSNERSSFIILVTKFMNEKMTVLHPNIIESPILRLVTVRNVHFIIILPIICTSIPRGIVFLKIKKARSKLFMAW